MSFLTDFRGDRPPDRKTPERVYASLDEEASSEGRYVLEAVEADWFDTEERSGPWLNAYGDVDLDGHVSLVEVRPDVISVPWPETHGREWLELELSTEPSDDARHYVNLFAAPDEQRLNWARTVPYSLEDRLNEAHSLDPLDDADEDALAALLSPADAADAAAVYDVGQGACNALIADGKPQLYFDFGGGSLANSKSYPAQLQSFCFGADPPVVLSHWDTDHWATANRDTRARQRAWIVPRQSRRLRPNQLAFLIALLNANTPHRVSVWGSAPQFLAAGRILLERGTGTSMNDSGIALIWNEAGATGRMLFPADASYDRVPSATGDFTSLVVAHHGGITHATFVPPPDGASHGRLAYSFGDPNTHKHPRAKEEADHAALWGPGLRTPALRASLGHVHLYWSDTQPDATPACAGMNCDLICCQR